MDFNLETDLKIFDELFKKRPELNLEGFKKDLNRYYLPFAKKLIDLRKQKNNTVLVGVSAIQGAGKTTQGEVMEILLSHFGHSTISLSIDDHYITHKELNTLREKDPRFIRRGVTHDISLAISELKKLEQMKDGEVVLVAGYDKGAQKGDGDRFRWLEETDGLEVKTVEGAGMIHLLSATYNGTPLLLPENMGADVPVEEKDEAVGWRIVTINPDFVFYDGWMLGARRVIDESVFDQNLPALETPEAKQFARDVNQKLEQYHELWGMLNFLNVLYVPHYEISLTWRDQAEEALRAKGEGMSKDEIREFVHYFWRSVHPAIHIKNLAMDEIHTNQVVIINEDHSIGEILNPGEVKKNYS